MIIRHVTLQNLADALDRASEQFAGNITGQVNGLNEKRVRLSVRDSYGPGARRSASGRRMASACWHAHKAFFQALFEIAPLAVIQCSPTDRRTGRPIGYRADSDFVDWEVGSEYRGYVMASELCDCGK